MVMDGHQQAAERLSWIEVDLLRGSREDQTKTIVG
jgi:hypothetical protein